MEDVVAKMEDAQKKGRMATYLALDTTFHELIFKHGENDYLAASYSRYIGKIAALRTHLSELPQHTKLSFDEHKLLAKAARKGDEKKIRRLLAEHIDRTRQAYNNSKSNAAAT